MQPHSKAPNQASIPLPWQEATEVKVKGQHSTAAFITQRARATTAVQAGQGALALIEAWGASFRPIELPRSQRDT